MDHTGILYRLQLKTQMGKKFYVLFKMIVP